VKKLTKDEYLDSLDPDNLNLEKKDLIAFCNKCIKEWRENKIANFKYIAAMSLMIGAISVTPESVMKMVWKKILVWFWDLQYENALAENEGMLKRLRGIGSG
tara:strand:+ start:419 stop:724 length:306 start_codon:yes stop_codon:yes gene_type:complete